MVVRDAVRWAGWLFLCVLATGSASTAWAGAQEEARPEVRERMERLIEFLDSPLYEDLATWDEHVVMAFRRARGHGPRPLEAFVLGRLRDQIGLPRSAVLGHALREHDRMPDWERLEQFLGEVSETRFLPDPSIRSEARALAAAYPGALAQLVWRHQWIRPELSVPQERERQESVLADSHPPGQAFNIYFGYLHAHSELSDGTGAPLKAYEFARDIGGLDFFALTDHGELLAIWPWENKWERLRAAADATDRPGSFAALWGFEWSNPLLGHLNVLNSDDYTGALHDFTLAEIYQWIAQRPGAFAQFNHPGDYNFLGIEFRRLLLESRVRRQMVGIEVLNGDDGLDRYHYSGGYRSDFGYIDEGNQRGWRLGPVGTQDNHDADWGIRNGFRTAVLATELSRESIAEAFRSRRFYATEDKDLELRFSSKGYPMGSELSGSVRQFDVDACDGSGDRFREIRFYRNGRLLDTREVDGVCVDASFTDIRFQPAYYHVIVRQHDDDDVHARGDEAISAPIWYDGKGRWPGIFFWQPW